MQQPLLDRLDLVQPWFQFLIKQLLHKTRRIVLIGLFYDCLHSLIEDIYHASISQSYDKICFACKKTKKILGYQEAEPNINDEATFMSNQSINQYAKVRDKCHDIVTVKFSLLGLGG